jgi:predicted RNase H-like HicB family nuclease
MEYTVLIEQRDGAWRALIPALANLGAEGTSRDEALRNAQHVAEVYLSSVEVASITVNRPQESHQPSGHPRKLLQALETFASDEEALREHFEEIAKERQQQRQQAQQQDVE